MKMRKGKNIWTTKIEKMQKYKPNGTTPSTVGLRERGERETSRRTNLHYQFLKQTTTWIPPTDSCSHFLRFLYLLLLQISAFPLPISRALCFPILYICSLLPFPLSVCGCTSLPCIHSIDEIFVDLAAWSSDFIDSFSPFLRGKMAVDSEPVTPGQVRSRYLWFSWES